MCYLDWDYNNDHHSHTTHYSDSNDRNTDTNQPFEFHAYEALLTSIKTLDSQESRKLDKTTRLLITTFNHKYKNSSVLPYEIQEKLLEAKIQLSTLQTKINDRRMTLENMIEDEEEMSLMNLTFLRNKPYLYILIVILFNNNITSYLTLYYVIIMPNICIIILL